MACCDAAQQAKELELEGFHRCDIRRDRTTEGRHSRQGRASVPNSQATIWLRKDAIPRTGEEHCSDHHAICVGQFMDGAQSAGQSVNDAAHDEPGLRALAARHKLRILSTSSPDRPCVARKDKLQRARFHLACIHRGRGHPKRFVQRFLNEVARDDFERAWKPTAQQRPLTPASTFWPHVSTPRLEHQVGRFLSIFEERPARHAYLRTHGQPTR